MLTRRRGLGSFLKVFLVAILCMTASVLLAILCMTASGVTASADDTSSDPMIVIHTGRHFVWYTKKSIWEANQAGISSMFDYEDQVFDQIISDWGVTPPQPRYNLLVNPQTGGGFASGDIGEIHAVTNQAAPGLAVAYDAYSGSTYGIKEYWAYALGTHEMVNLLTGTLSGGWPRDWWADDRSPFPAMTAVTVEKELGKNDISAAHDASFDKADKAYAMMKALQAHYGWSIFQNMFAMVKADGIKWYNIDFGNNPSAILTAYITAYITLGSGDPLDRIGANFFDSGVPGYNAAMTAQVLFARDNWKKNGGDGEAFLSGHYLSVGGYPDFAISALTPNTFCVAPGQSVSATFQVDNTHDFRGQIHFSVSGLPTGVSASFRQVGIDMYEMTLNASLAASAGASTMTLSGDASGTPVSAGHSLTLPVLVSATPQTAVNLASMATLYGVGNDHLVLSDSGGVDGSGFAYSGVLLGGAQTFAGTQFAIGLPADGQQGTYNAVTGVTLPLPQGQFSWLRMLGSANGGDRQDQVFTVHYTDGSSASFTQSLSDWKAPSKFPGETTVLTMPYSDITLGTSVGSRTLYGYSFQLNPQKTVQSFSMPDDRHVIGIAFTLVP
jgi:hypothetical protein